MPLCPVQIMCPVTEKDIQEHVRLRLEAERKEKELRKKEKLEAHLFTIVKLVRDSDIRDQIGSARWFDLANNDKVRACNLLVFSLFLKLAEVFCKGR